MFPNAAGLVLRSKTCLQMSSAKRAKAAPHADVRVSHLSELAPELQKKILVWCDGRSLMMLEQACQAFAPPPPRLSLIQETVRDSMRHRYPGAQLGVKSWPSLMRKHEQATEAAERWEPPEDLPADQDECEEVCDELVLHELVCDENKTECGMYEQRAYMSRMVVAKLRQSIETGEDDKATLISNWLLCFFHAASGWHGAMVAAGVTPVLVKALQSDMESVKIFAAGGLTYLAGHNHTRAVTTAGALTACVDVLTNGPQHAKDGAAGVLAIVAKHEQHTSAVVAAGAVEPCLSVLRSGPEDAQQNAASALAYISVQELHVGALVSAGAIEVLLGLLQTDSEGTQVAQLNAASSLHLIRS